MIKRLLGRFDWVLLALLGVALATGLVTLYSAGNRNPEVVLGQATNMAVALGALWAASQIPPHHLRRVAPAVYAGGLLLLIGVALFGVVSHGARRWLDVGITRIQPSELMKLGVPLMLAWYFDRREGALRLRDFAVGMGLLLVPVGLIMRQPDLGTALLITGSGFFVLYLAGLSWKIMAGFAAALAAALPVFWSLLHDYQRQRVLTLLDPTQDPLGAGYHIIQSTIALGSGGAYGKGWLHGTQAHLDFLPERTTDFIFAVYSEEFGFVGNVFLLSLFALILARAFAITAGAATVFARLLAGSLAFTFFMYLFVNMGMVSGILPVVGVPLPLISYGGTALVTMLTAFGMLMSVRASRKLVES